MKLTGQTATLLLVIGVYMLFMDDAPVHLVRERPASVASVIHFQ